MRNQHRWASSLLVTIAIVIATSTARAELRVVTTTPDHAAIARIIGGDRVKVESIAKGYQDPHYLEAKPSHMSRLRRADLLAYTGLELEVGWLPLLLEGSRNPKLAEGESGSLSMATGIEILEVPEHGERLSRADGDIHPLGNPHYSLDPRSFLAMVATMESRLAQLDPDGAGLFARNRAEFESRLRAKIPIWEARIAPWHAKTVVCYHKQWEYLFNWLGFEIAGYVENKAGIPPSPRHVQEITEMMVENDVDLLLIANFYEPAAAERLAERTGAVLLVLPASIEGEEGLSDPIAYFDAIISRLVGGFEASESR